MLCSVETTDYKTMGLRERKRLETYLRIEDKATALFLERNYDDVTLEEICEAAMVSRRTFFNYFQSKEHVAVGSTPVSFGEHDYDAIRDIEVPEGSSLSYELTRIVANARVKHARSIEQSSINPRLTEQLSERRMELLRRQPSLGLSKLSAFEKTRNKLAEAIVDNFGKFPEHRMLPHRSATQEARLVVTSTIMTLWAASILPSEPTSAYLTEESVDTTASDFAAIYAAQSERSFFNSVD